MQSRGWAITWRKCLLLVAFVTTTGVYSLTAQTTDDLELTRAARHFRRQVYLQYRTNRPEFDRRRAAAVQAEEAYRAAGADEASAERLRTWLLAAAAASESRAALPALPSFGPDTRVAETPSLPEPVTTEPTPREPLGPLPPPKTDDSEDTAKIVEIQEAPQEAPAETPAEEPETPVESPAAPIAEIDEAPTDSPYHEETPLVETPTADAPSDEPFPVEESTPPEESSVPPTSPDADIFEQTEVEVETGVEAPPADEVPADEPETIEEPAHTPTPAPETSITPTFEPNVPSSSGVNITELSARVAGHNFAVRGILLDWRRGERGDLDELTEAVERTESLGRRYGLLATYVDLLTASERTETGELEPLTEVFTVLGNAIADQRANYETSDAPEDVRKAAIERLNALSQRLAAAYNLYAHDSERQP